MPLRSKWWVILPAVALPLLFAGFTHHAWEDYFITLRSSRNLVEGHGLVFNPGERVHTFTSPLGVLVPAACLYLAGPEHELAALWIFRLINAVLLAATAALLWRRADTLQLGLPGRVLLFGLLLFDAKLTDFAINGMETAMLVFFTLLLWSELESPDAPRAGWLAAAVGGLMWTRPDAFVLAGALVVPHLVFRPPAGSTSRPVWSPLWRGVLLGGLLYLPWFAWAWRYYGSPVPHTIVAKSAYMGAVNLRDVLSTPWRALTGPKMFADVFLPTYGVFGGWPPCLTVVAQLLGAVSVLGWLVPGWPAAGRRASLTVFLGMFYLCALILFPWYLPPWSALAYLAIAFAFDRAYAALAHRRMAAPVLRAVCTVLIVLQFAVLAATAWQMRVHQRLVEDGVRRSIGEWLHGNAMPGDTVFLEPLGYIGYYSRLKTYDFPGLSSPEVVSAVRSGARRYAELIARLHPTWLVLRPAEASRPEFQRLPVLADYQLVKAWDAVPALDAIRLLPGRPWVEYEAQFLVFRRRASP